LPWAPAYTPTFRRDYKNLGQADQDRVNGAIKDILDAQEPRSLGRPKLGKWRGAYGYDVGRAIRVLYAVENHEKIVTFLRCGPHPIY